MRNSLVFILLALISAAATNPLSPEYQKSEHDDIVVKLPPFPTGFPFMEAGFGIRDDRFYSQVDQPEKSVKEHLLAAIKHLVNAGQMDEWEVMEYLIHHRKPQSDIKPVYSMNIRSQTYFKPVFSPRDDIQNHIKTVLAVADELMKMESVNVG